MIQYRLADDYLPISAMIEELRVKNMRARPPHVMQYGHDGEVMTDAQMVAYHRLGARCETVFFDFADGPRRLRWTYTNPVVNGRQRKRPEFVTVPTGFKLDIKGVPWNHWDLRTPAGRLTAEDDNTIFVLIGAQEHPWYLMMGWEFGEVLRKAPIVTLAQPSHFIAQGDLRGIDTLLPYLFPQDNHLWTL